MLRGMSSREFTEWMAYARVEPFGETIADIRAGVVAALLVPTRKGRRGKSPADFFPWLAEDAAMDKANAKPANASALWAQTCVALGLLDAKGRIPAMIPTKRGAR